MFFQGLTIGALLVGIAFYKVRNTVRDGLGLKDLKLKVDLTKGALIAGQGVAIALAGAMAVLAFNTLLAVAPYIALGAALYGAYALGRKLGDWLIQFGEWIAGFDWGGAARNIIDGLVNGLAAGWNKLKKSVQGLAKGISTTFRETLGIHSPSRIMAENARYVGQGVEVGLEDSAPGVQSSAANMGGVIPSSFSAGAAQGAPVRAASGGSITIASLVVQTQATDCKGIADSIRSELQRVLEDVLVEMGGSTA